MAILTNLMNLEPEVRSSQAKAVAFAKTNSGRFISELQEFVRIPSISVEPERARDVKHCALWLAAQLRQCGLPHVQVFATARHPIVYAEWRGAPGKPTVLIYGHYDVQPVDPIREWKSPPFDPVVRGANLFGRGASDDKGQLFVHVKAIEAWLNSAGRLPVNVKCLFEGEEEIGSANLTGFIQRNRRALRADVALMSDTRMLGPNRPALTYALRGQLGLELELRGPRSDLHSGNFGGVVHDPLQALCEIVAQLHRPDGRVAIPGFYDKVRVPPPRERVYMERNGPSDSELASEAGAASNWGETGYSLYERVGVRPSLSINGIVGGYTGSGGKSVIPARALAKLSFRLVPDQDPEEIEALFRRFIVQTAPPTVRAIVRTFTKSRPVVIDRSHPAMRAAVAAYRAGFGRTPVFLRSGGTIPVVHTFQTVLGMPTVLMGFALPDDNMHAPNEKFHLPNFERGILTSLTFLYLIGCLGQRRIRQVKGQLTRRAVLPRSACPEVFA